MLRSTGALGFVLVVLSGCVNPQARMQMAEENEKERDLDVRVIKDVSDIGNEGPMQVLGIGLVTGLAGTGHCPHGYHREVLEQYLLKRSGPRGGEMGGNSPEIKIRKVLDDPSNALVIVTGQIPAGVRKGDRFDVEVTLPAASKATSLAGGFLDLCLLRVYERESTLSDKRAGSSALHSSHVFAHSKGQLMIGFGTNSDPNELKVGRIWQGGVSRIDRPYAFMMKTDDKSIRIANSVAERINFMYQDDARSRAYLSDQQKQILLMGNVANQLNLKHDPTGVNQKEMAKAMSKEVINVRIPFAYRYDHERFMRVSLLTPLRDTDPNMVRYRQRLQKMLLDPRDTNRAALRLEALGRESIPLLKPGLESEHPLVRFASAEALAYLGSTAGVDMLAQLAQTYPVFAKHCTIALANLGESICRDKLGEFLASDDPALRCAAFHALSLLDEADPQLGGRFLNDTFWLYRLPQASRPMVYFSTSKRAQVVLFGRDIAIAPTTRMLIGKDYTVAPHERDGQFLVNRITTRGEEKRVCTNRLDEVLAALADLGATYPDVVDFLRKATDYQNINCPVGNWTTPEVSLETLVEAGRNLK